MAGGIAAEHVESANVLAPPLPPQLSMPRKRSGRTLLASIASGAVHLAALLVLARVTISGYPQVLSEIQALMHEEPRLEEVELPQELEIAEPDDERRERLVAAEAFSLATVADEQPLVEELIATEDLVAPDLAAMSIATPKGVEIDDVIVQKGRAGEEVMTVEGAVDRITHEIVSALEHGKLLVIWLMDASISLVDDREAVANRLERVFDELGALGSLQGDMLVNAVVGFGRDVQWLLPPSEDAKKVIEAIRQVPIDDSGIENTFTAVIESLNRYKSLKSRQDRQLMVVIWTDEAGDDYVRLDDAIRVCQRLTAPVFTVGPSAVFGRQKGVHFYKHPEDGQVYPIEVDRGPEAPRFERLRVPYWFEGPQFERLSSGIGPFALTRLAVQTSGAYFINDPKPERSPYALAAMRRYMPEYDSAASYQREVQQSPLRQAVLKAAEATLMREMKGTPRLEFEPTGNNFQDQLREAQQSVAFNNIVLSEALAAFPARGLEAEYEKEPSPRWRAWYDLTYGRLLAMQVRCNEYNWACAEMKAKGAEFVNKQSNHWTFKPADKLRVGAGSEKQAALAKQLLERCVAENPGTPWETLAKRELAYPFGFEIEERYIPRPEERPGPGGNGRMMGRRTEQLRELERPKQVALPKL